MFCGHEIGEKMVSGSGRGRLDEYHREAMDTHAKMNICVAIKRIVGMDRLGSSRHDIANGTLDNRHGTITSGNDLLELTMR